MSPGADTPPVWMSPRTNPESRYSLMGPSAPPNSLPARENPDRPILAFAAFSALAFMTFGSASWYGAPALPLATAPAAVVAPVLYFAVVRLKNRG